ncbi:Cyclin N-terminal domain-containing protein [Fusarium sp. LHS14.1]|nr:Cyclin N-terminal domain-containing protein [Fusarium sp. LHS14.1]
MAHHDQSPASEEASRLYDIMRDENIARELSCLVRDEYLEEIMRHREYMEVYRCIKRIPAIALTDRDQHQTLPDTAVIDNQPEIQWSMRVGLMDFLIEVHAAFELLPETLFLSVNLLDRYCSKRYVNRIHYPLLGCTALLISAKYNDEKRRIPKIHQLKAMCCDMHSINMFILMEKHVLDTLDWVIGHPTSDSLSRQLADEQGDDREVAQMAAYLREIALYHREFVSTKPSIMARTSLALARTVLDRAEASEGERDQPVYLKLSNHLHNPSPTLVLKYSTDLFSRSSQKLAKFVAKNAIVTC